MQKSFSNRHNKNNACKKTKKLYVTYIVQQSLNVQKINKKKRQQTKTQKAEKKQKTQEQNQKIKSDTGFQLVPKNHHKSCDAL